jgi:hypothetical protein
MADVTGEVGEFLRQHNVPVPVRGNAL